MKNRRLRNYLQQKATMKANNPVNAETIENHPDKRIDQDFQGYPHAPAKEELINPKTKEQKKKGLDYHIIIPSNKAILIQFKYLI